MTRQQWIGGLTALVLASGVTYAQGPNRLSASLKGAQEVPAISTPAAGAIVVEIDEDAQEVRYELSYSGLQGAVSMAHIHIAQPGVNGGIMAWLCKTTQAQPVPNCPTEGSVSGTITPANVTAVASQGIAAMEFDEFVAAMRNGIAYANVHSSLFPGGEIRGQLQAGGGHR